MRFFPGTDDDDNNDTSQAGDAELLRRFAARQDGEGAEAFAVLARRHTGLVLDIALRVTGSRPLAEEIVQTVFVQLARKAPRVAGARVVTAWLHRTALLESRAVLRAESRRRKNTAEAAEAMAAESFHTLPAASDPRMTELLRSLDEALESLSATEREVLLGHYYGRQSYQEAGQRIGTSEAGARQLAARARKRLAAWFRRRHGARISLSGVSTLLAGHFPLPGAGTTGGGMGTGWAGLSASASVSASAAKAVPAAAASHTLLAEAATRAALSAAARSPGGMLSGFLPCLSFMKLPATLCLIAGFLIPFLPGSGMGREDVAAGAPTVKPARPRLPLPSRRSPPGTGAGADVAAGKAGLAEGFDPEQFEKELTVVVELSRKRYLGFGIHSENNFVAASAFDLSYGRQMQLARLVMYQPVSQMPGLLEACRRADPEAKGSMVLEAVFARWAETDPAAARAAMAMLSVEAQDYALHGICGTLISRDVAAAARGVLNYPAPGEGPRSGLRNNFVLGLISDCVRRDPRAAVTACLDAPEPIAGEALGRGMMEWINMDPEAATDWFCGICSTRSVPGDDGPVNLSFGSLKTQHPALAARLAASLPPGERRTSLMAQLEATPLTENSSH